MTMLVEKYRPKRFEDVIGIDERIIEACNQDMPHFLFVGKPGTGKTTTARIIINVLKADCLQLNASDERGIETIRDKVKSFAMTKSTNDKLKIVFLDEADYLTPIAMVSLRNIMEAYHKNCRFILTGNYGNKFIDAIVSRCVRVEFREPPTNDVIARLKHVVKEESIKITDEALSAIVGRFYPDIRRMINTLQELSTLGRQIIISDVKKEEKLVPELFSLLKQKKLIDARKLLLNNSVDYETLTLTIYDWVWSSSLTSPQKIDVIQHLCNVDKFLGSVVSKELLFADFMVKVIKCLN